MTFPSNQLTRRRLLVSAGGGLLGASLLSACGGAATTSASSSTSAATPVRGGTLTVGMITNGVEETLNPTLASGGSNPDILRWAQLYDNLFTFSSDLTVQAPGLAVAAEANSTATVWTLHLRPDVTWHDGKGFTAADVVYTVKQWGDPQALAFGQANGLIDFHRVRAHGPLVVEIPLKSRVGEFPSLLTGYGFEVIQDGATQRELSTKPVGTGPFSFISFTPGQQSVFKANPHYWKHGGPDIDTLIVNSSFTDDVARQNALLGGQINVAPIFPGLLAREQTANSSIKILRSAGAQAYNFYMRLDRAPFNDVRVRQAIRLIADRQELINNALSGYGTVGNDLIGEGTKYFAADLKRSQDLEQAKSLLKAAGRSDLRVTLQTSDVIPGFVEAATLLAQQAQGAGVKIHVQVVPSANYFSYAAGYPWSFGEDAATGNPFPSLTAAFRGALVIGAPYNETKWGSQPGGAAANAVATRAIAAADPTAAESLWRQAQELQFNEGGYVIYANADYIDAIQPTVVGLTTTPAGNLNGFDFLNAGFAHQ